jgi:two-component system, NtrC family, sensor kinase
VSTAIMPQENKFQLSTAILTILTMAAVASAVINLEQRQSFRLPDDGVIWVDRAHGVEALEVQPAGSAGRAGLRRGDLLRRIGSVPVASSLDVTRILVGVGAWNRADYFVQRGGVEFKSTVVVGDTPVDPAVNYQVLVGIAYLAIGLFVYFRRGSAEKARHFYILCLASFIFYSFHYTGKLNNFDKIIYWGNVAAGLFAPTIFLHFCLTFPDKKKGMQAGLLYLPATVLMALWVAVASGALRIGMPLVEVRWLLDRIWLPFLTLFYLLGGLALAVQYRKTEDTILRQQLKWLRNGTFFGIAPFALLYVAPYLLGAVPGPYLKASVLSLPLIPLTLAYAVVRYRLMDVDIIFQRGYAYTLATLCVLGAFYGIVFSLGSLVHKNFSDLGNTGLVSVMLIAAFLFQPIRNRIQERLDRYFYRDRYDYRRTLEEFARELSSETDLDTMFRDIAERLVRTLNVQRIAFFLADEENGGFRLERGTGVERARDLDLSFLASGHSQPYIFFERTRNQLDVVSQAWPSSVRRTIADLDLTYYVPCRVRGRILAYLGVSRTEAGDFLSSEDIELLITLSGYVGIAVENASLYRSLQLKVEEYERLKEFSENIVESINVGILAADLEDRVESWNNQIERLTGISRQTALGRKLESLFPEELVAQFNQVRGENGIHHIYKFALYPAGAAHSAAANGQNGSGLSTNNAGLRQAVLNVAIAPLVSKNMEQIGRLIIFDDVTDRTELERRLVQADKLSSIGLLAAGVAHEVNTPLAVISTYAQMLAKKVSDDEQKSVLLDKIAKQTFRASEIVNSLLNFSRTATTDFAPVDLNRVIQETLSLLEHQLQKTGIRVEAELEPGLASVHGNTGKLQQVFLNLFLNARDAMRPGGTLEVRTWAGARGARVEVLDSGEGIPPDLLSRIYDPFFTTKTQNKGTGLGLSVTYGIVQEHGGSIEASNRPSGGARFYLEFPWHGGPARVEAGGVDVRQPAGVA